jgi:hypothetical protein
MTLVISLLVAFWSNRNGAFVYHSFVLSCMPSLTWIENDDGLLPHAEFYLFAPSFESGATGNLGIHLCVSKQTSIDMTHHHILETYTGQVSPAYVCSKVKTALSTQSDFTVAIATIHRLITARFKGYFAFFAALRAYCGKHLASESIAAISVTL